VMPNRMSAADNRHNSVQAPTGPLEGESKRKSEPYQDRAPLDGLRETTTPTEKTVPRGSLPTQAGRHRLRDRRFTITSPLRAHPSASTR
jgi:hypothetical protein